MRVIAEFLSTKEERPVDLADDATGMDLFKALGLAPDAHLLARDDTPIPLDEPLRDGDRLLLIPVVSGGLAP